MSEFKQIKIDFFGDASVESGEAKILEFGKLNGDGGPLFFIGDAGTELFHKMFDKKDFIQLLDELKIWAEGFDD